MLLSFRVASLLVLRAGKRQNAVLPAEAERVGDSCAHALLPRLVGYHVEIAVRVECPVVNGGREHAGVNCQYRRRRLNRPGGTERMTNHGFV